MDEAKMFPWLEVNQCFAFVVDVLYIKSNPGSCSALTTKCDGSAALSCVNEPHVFVVLFGAFAGAAAWHRLHFGNGNLVAFPDVEQPGMAQIRLNFWHTCRASFFRVTRWEILMELTV